jgi:hypothetical protein
MPAFDSYFINAANNFGFGRKTLSNKNFLSTLSAINENAHVFKKHILKFRKTIHPKNYPDVRIVDLLMWGSMQGKRL